MKKNNKKFDYEANAPDSRIPSNLASNKERLDSFTIFCGNDVIRFLGEKSMINRRMSRYFPNQDYIVHLTRDVYQKNMPSSYLIDVDNDYILERV